MPGGDSDISIQSVYVSSTRIVFSGQSSPPEGSCLHTQLLADGEPETWWPDEACATVAADGSWQIAVELGAADAPARLDPTLDYVLSAWCPDNSSSPVQFWFDLAGPPAPDSPAFKFYHSSRHSGPKPVLQNLLASVTLAEETMIPTQTAPP